MPELLPLEAWLQRAARNSNEFPTSGENYYDTYNLLKTRLNTNVYNNIQGAILRRFNTNDVASPGVEIYTDHGLGHVNAVIKMSGKILGCIKNNSKIQLKPYEVFLLLCAILCHDIGNIHGRHGHELKVKRTLREKNIAILNDIDVDIISKIAISHTGKRVIGVYESSDTITQLSIGSTKLFGIPYRPRVIAAILRLSDELSEDKSRIPTILLNDIDVVSGASGIYLLYGNTIVNSDVDLEARSIRIDYEVNRESLVNKFKRYRAVKVDGVIVSYEEEEVYIVDEILNRLTKINRERIYCNRHADGIFNFSSVVANLSVIWEGDDNNMLEEKMPQMILSDGGYPGDEAMSNIDLSGWNAQNLKLRYATIAALRVKS